MEEVEGMALFRLSLFHVRPSTKQRPEELVVERIHTLIDIDLGHTMVVGEHP